MADVSCPSKDKMKYRRTYTRRTNRVLFFFSRYPSIATLFYRSALAKTNLAHSSHHSSIEHILLYADGSSHSYEQVAS